MGRWGEGSHVPALEKESGQLLLNSHQRAWERTEPSELAGTSIRPSPQACVGSHWEKRRPGQATHSFPQCPYTGIPALPTDKAMF